MKRQAEAVSFQMFSVVSPKQLPTHTPANLHLVVASSANETQVLGGSSICSGMKETQVKLQVEGQQAIRFIYCCRPNAMWGDCSPRTTLSIATDCHWPACMCQGIDLEIVLCVGEPETLLSVRTGISGAQTNPNFKKLRKKFEKHVKLLQVERERILFTFKISPRRG